MADEAAPAASSGGARPVLLLGALLALVTQLPYLQAVLSPPPGHRFLGYFFFVDDRYNYLSFVQQAEDGAFLFRNKLVLGDPPPRLINLEWWTIGRLSALLGGRPRLTYQVFGLGASFLFLFGIERALRRAGVTEDRRLSALGLVALGSGLGGLGYWTGAFSFALALDLRSGLFPFVEMLTNPHFVIGTALLLWTLAAWIEGRVVRALILGTILGLTRPYDLVLLVLVRGLAVLATERPLHAALRRLLPLAGYAPVAAYCYWVFYREPSFAFYAEAAYLFPPRVQWLVALGPAAALAATAFRGGPASAWRAHWTVWAVLAGVVIAVRPVHFSLQFLVGIGVPLLSLGAVGLNRFPRVVTLAAAAVLALSSLAALRIVHTPGPARWFVPATALDLVEALATECRAGDLAFLPGELGLYAGGLTACHAYTSHAIEPDHARRAGQTEAFYRRWDPASRAAFLDAECVDLVTVPATMPPEAFLGRSPGARVAAAGGLAIHRWKGSGACGAPRQVR